MFGPLDCGVQCLYFIIFFTVCRRLWCSMPVVRASWSEDVSCLSGTKYVVPGSHFISCLLVEAKEDDGAGFGVCLALEEFVEVME